MTRTPPTDLGIVRSEKPALAPGQVWVHVGFTGPYGDVVPATGLRVRILRRHERGGWVCNYPDNEKQGERRYPNDSFQTAYVLEGSA